MPVIFTISHLPTPLLQTFVWQFIHFGIYQTEQTNLSHQEAGRGKTMMQLGWESAMTGVGEEEFQGSMYVCFYLLAI